MKDYKENIHYENSELEDIYLWWQTHKEYDVNEYEDYVEIVKREDCSWLILNYKDYLTQTDYVVIKIYEAKIKGEDTTEMEEHYADILTRREEAREKIRELEGKTIEE